MAEGVFAHGLAAKSAGKLSSSPIRVAFLGALLLTRIAAETPILCSRFLEESLG